MLNMLYIKLFLLLLVAGLWVRGGKKGGGAVRDVGVPILLGLGVALLIKDNILNRLLYGILTCAGFQAIRLGYGNYSPEDDDRPSFLASIIHDRQGSLVRAIWGLLVASCASLGLLLGGYISLWSYLAYIIGNSLVGFLVSRLRLPVLLADLLIGASIASIIMFI